MALLPYSASSLAAIRAAHQPLDADPTPERGGADPTPEQGGADPTPVQGGADPTPVQGGADPTPVRGGADPTPVRGGADPPPVRPAAGPTAELVAVCLAAPGQWHLMGQPGQIGPRARPCPEHWAAFCATVAVDSGR